MRKMVATGNGCVFGYNRWLALLLFFMAVALMARGGNFDFDKFKSAHGTDALPELVSSGYDCIKAVQADSAIAYYTIAISRYSGKLPYADKRRCAIAYINCGYVYLVYKQNAEQSYLLTTKGVEMATKVGMDDICAVGYDNLAKMYEDYGDYAQALVLHKKAFSLAVRINHHQVTLNVFPDLLIFAFNHQFLDSVSVELETFARLMLPDSLPMAKYSQCLCDGMMDLQEDDYDAAIGRFYDAIKAIDASSERPRREVNILLLIAKVYSMKHFYREGLACLKQAETLSIRNGMYDLLDDAYKAYAVCCQALGNAALASHYEHEALSIRDSLFNARKFGMIKDLEFAHSVQAFNAEMAQMREDAEKDAAVMRILLTSVVCALLLFLWIFIKKRQLGKSYWDLFRKNVELIKSKDKDAERLHACETRLAEYEALAGKAEERYKNSVLDDESKDNILSKVVYVFENDAAIFDPDFSLERLSELVASKPKYVSQVMNEKTGKNFNLLLGEYRVKEACRRLLDVEKYGRLTIEAISESVGYRSRTHFSSLFKKETGLTPAEFAKQARKKKKYRWKNRTKPAD